MSLGASTTNPPRTVTALWYREHGKIDLRTESLPVVSAGDVLVEALYSGISRGTERLVRDGGVPKGEYERMRCPYQAGNLSLPVKYGYALVGCVIDGDKNLLGRNVFMLHPHQTAVVLPGDAAIPLPETLPPKRAVLAANMETALNVIWDSGASLGDRVVVIGCGVVGLLVVRLLARMPGSEVIATDIEDRKAAIATAFGARFVSPRNLADNHDVAIHTSASQAGLQLAVNAVAMEGRIIEASWHGGHPVSLDLGGAFHAKRLTIVSSQVSRPPPDRRARWTNRRRLEMAASLLDDPLLDQLLTSEIAFADAPACLGDLFDPARPELAITLRYPAAEEEPECTP